MARDHLLRRAMLAVLVLPGTWRCWCRSLYRFSRDPMYVAVTLILAGWAIGFRSRPFWIYALVVIVAFQLRVVLVEEPWLARTQGEQWAQYRARVPRWLL